MTTVEGLLKRRMEFSDILLTEAQPFLVSEPRVWAKQFGDAVVGGDIMGQMLKARIPFAKASLRTDVMVFHEIPTQDGLLYAVQNYGGAVGPLPVLQPTDFMQVIDKSIPRAAFVREGTFSSKWATELSDAKKPDDWKEFLDQIERKTGKLSGKLLDHANDWTYSTGRVTHKLPFTMQIIPLGNSKCVFLYKRFFQPGLWSAKQMKFRVAEFLDLACWLKDALAGYAYDGTPAVIEVPVMTLSLLAIPELAQVIPVKGTDLNFPASGKTYVAASVSASAPTANAIPSSEEKFCIACGRKMVARATFCPTCGAKQSGN